jgi:uncharacterized damage-inducible protein DinB
LRDAVADVSPAEALERPGPGDWSIQEIAVHLADSDAIHIDRMKRVLTEDSPQLLNADESAYAARLHPHEQSLADAVDLVVIGRRQWARVLAQLDDDDFERTGTHDEAGTRSVLDMLRGATDHLEHHLGFVAAKLARLRG